MKLLIFASIAVVLALAESESESDSNALYLGSGSRIVGQSYYREKLQMHPYDAVPFKTFNNYAVYPYSYNPKMLPNAYNHFYKRRLFKRDAEADAKPKADAQFYYRPGVYTSRVNVPSTTGIASYGHAYTTPYVAYNSFFGYQNYQQMPYNSFF